MYVCIYVCMCIYIYIYIYASASPSISFFFASCSSGNAHGYRPRFLFPAACRKGAKSGFPCCPGRLCCSESATTPSYPASPQAASRKRARHPPGLLLVSLPGLRGVVDDDGEDEVHEAQRHRDQGRREEEDRPRVVMDDRYHALAPGVPRDERLEVDHYGLEDRAEGREAELVDILRSLSPRAPVHENELKKNLVL